MNHVRPHQQNGPKNKSQSCMLAKASRLPVSLIRRLRLHASRTKHCGKGCQIYADNFYLLTLLLFPLFMKQFCSFPNFNLYFVYVWQPSRFFFFGDLRETLNACPSGSNKQPRRLAKHISQNYFPTDCCCCCNVTKSNSRDNKMR